MRNPLNEQIHYWSQKGSNEQVLQWLRDGVKFPLIEEVHSFEQQNRKISDKENVSFSQK